MAKIIVLTQASISQGLKEHKNWQNIGIQIEFSSRNVSEKFQRDISIRTGDLFICVKFELGNMLTD